MRPSDTALEAHRRQVEAVRGMGMAARLELACEMAAFAREAAAAGIRLRHPDYDEDQVRWALFRHWIRDDRLFRNVWPDAPLLAP